MPAPTTTSLRLSRVIAAPVARVFEAWTRPEQVKQWSCPEDARVVEVEIDPAVWSTRGTGRKPSTAWARLW